MPLLAALLSSVGSAIFGLIAALVGTKVAIKLVAVSSLAGIYISCVILFTNTISPWIGAVFFSQYGQLLGLLFPPIAGTVMASLAGYWGCVVSVKYVSSLTKMAVS